MTLTLHSWYILFPKRNELLTQYPELAEELEEEIRKMEEENAATQAELEQMKHQLSSSTHPQAEKENLAEDDDDSPEQKGLAFVSQTNNTRLDGEDSSISHSTIDNSQEASSDFTISEEDVSDGASHVDETEGEIRDDGVQGEKDDLGSQSSTSATKNDVVTPADTPPLSKEDFTLSHLAIEGLRAFVRHAQDDLRRIIELVLPVMRPLLTAGDVAWRQIKALFVNVRDAYYESSFRQSSGDTSTTTADEGQVDHSPTKPEECDVVS
jgi:regulator of replication initiation timing